MNDEIKFKAKSEGGEKIDVAQLNGKIRGLVFFPSNLQECAFICGFSFTAGAVIALGLFFLLGKLAYFTVGLFF